MENALSLLPPSRVSGTSVKDMSFRRVFSLVVCEPVGLARERVREVFGVPVKKRQKPTEVGDAKWRGRRYKMLNGRRFRVIDSYLPWGEAWGGANLLLKWVRIWDNNEHHLVNARSSPESDEATGIVAKRAEASIDGMEA